MEGGPFGPLGQHASPNHSTGTGSATNPNLQMEEEGVPEKIKKLADAQPPQQEEEIDVL